MATYIKKMIRGPFAIVQIAWALTSGIPFRVLEMTGQVLPENEWGCRIRGAIHRPFLKECGRNLQVAQYAKLEHHNQIEIGDDVYIGHGSWISGLRGGVLLEDEVMLGPYVKMVSSNHTFCNGSARFAKGIGGRITIGSGSWIASGVTVTAGVAVGRSCLLAAGAVVTKNIPDGSIAAGIPARIIGETPLHNQEGNAEEKECIE